MWNSFTDYDWGNAKWVYENSPVETVEILETVRKLAEKHKVIAFDFESDKVGFEKKKGKNADKGDALNDPIYCVSFCSTLQSAYSVRVAEESKVAIAEFLNWMVCREDIVKVAHNLKYDCKQCGG